MKTDKEFVDQIRAQGELRAYMLELMLNTVFPTLPGELYPASDPTQSNSSIRRALARQVEVVHGRIVDAIAYTNAYKVQLERGNSVVIASDITQSSLGPIGVRQYTTYAPGTGVMLLYHPQSNHAMIIGARPDFMTNARHGLGDMIVQGGNAGLHVDQVHKFPFRLKRRGGISDFSAGRPFDQIPAGNWGQMSASGLGFHLDDQMAYMRVDEETGAFLFYRDSLARYAGHNMEVRSAGHHGEEYDDNHEFDWEHAFNAYLWEARGGFTPTAILWRFFAPYDVQQWQPWYSRYEPVFDDQQPIMRYRHFKGYLGQGQKRTLFTLPKIIPSETQTYVIHPNAHNPNITQTISVTTQVQRYTQQNKFRGLSEENWDQDGHIGIRSAKGIIISKRLIIPEPKRMKRPNDEPSGDNAQNYRFNGLYHDPAVTPPPHRVLGIKDSGDPYEQLVRCSAFMDTYAHVFNWKGLHQFQYHDKDWYVPQESEYTPETAAMPDGIPTFGLLDGAQYLPRPPAVFMEIDHRYGTNAAPNVIYFPNNSYLALLDDGGVLLGDGWGSEIRMTGGSIFNTCAGDIWELPGKNWNAWAGYDAIIRAHNCVDISATFRDVRIKADINCYILAGNEVCGAVLIESRAPGIDFQCMADDPADPQQLMTGVILRAPHSIVAARAPTVLLTNCGSRNGDTRGEFIIDAHDANLVVHCKHMRRCITESALDYIGGKIFDYNQDYTFIEGDLMVDGSGFFSGCLMVCGNGAFRDNVVATSYGLNTPDSLNDFAMTLENLQLRKEYLDDKEEEFCRDADRIQDTTDFCTTSFFFRTSEQERCVPFAMFETRWQQMARLFPKPVKKWAERPVIWECDDSITYPHPGKKSWADDPNYHHENLDLYQTSLNLNVDRAIGGVYEDPTYKASTTEELDGKWLVIIRPCS